MNILFLTTFKIDSIQEQNIYTDLLREFLNHGHTIFLVTSTLDKTEHTKVDDNLEILKIKTGKTQKNSFFEKAINILTLENKYAKLTKQYFGNKKLDLILYVSPPITLFKTINMLKKISNAKTYLLLKDIFPQNATDIEIISYGGFTYRYFRKKEEKLYQVSDFIGCMSRANVDYIKKHNKEILKNTIVEVCPNTITPSTDTAIYLSKENIFDKYLIPQHKKVFVYGGNLGKPQDIDFIIECIKLNEFNENEHILIIGDGTEYNKLNQFIFKNGIKNTQLIKYLPKEEYDNIIKYCTAGLIFLDYRFTIPNYPSRLLSYMEAGLPVIAATDEVTDIKSLIEDNKIGRWVPSNSPHLFNDIMTKVSNIDLTEMKSNAMQYLKINFTSKQSYQIIQKHFTNFENKKLEK